MILPIKFLDAAEVEASEAIDWYEERERGLGTAFRESVEAAISFIQKRPLAFPVVHGSNVRQAQVGRFPYTVYFAIQSERILVYSVFHNSRNPMIWHGRIS
jgi:plasmid stabilization system protein ParE